MTIGTNNWDVPTGTSLEMVFCYQNCSDLMWEKINSKSERWEKKFGNRILFYLVPPVGFSDLIH